MLKTITILFSLIWSLQSHSQKNLIPNPSFEVFSDTPFNWYYNGQHFTEIVKFWSSPTPASPDAYGPKVPIPEKWAAKGFGKMDPHTGKKMVGITVYGCKKGKPHCREYIQIRLAEPMVIGQEYELSHWIAHLTGSLYVNNVGILFSKDEVSHVLDVRLEHKPQIYAEDIIEPSRGTWKKLTYKYKADDEYEFITIGNFSPDIETDFLYTQDNQFKYAYYYLDDIKLSKEEPILPVPDRPDPLTNIKLEEGKTIRLKNIYFDHDRADFLSRSYDQLDKLVDVLESHPMMKIRVQGHTDIRGDYDYNLSLSNGRASAVVEYLIAKGISSHRLSYKGFGSTKPISSNNTQEGRRMNRRVEFVILKK